MITYIFGCREKIIDFILEYCNNDFDEFSDIIENSRKHIHYFNGFKKCYGKGEHFYFTAFDTDKNEFIAVLKLKTGGEYSCCNPEWKNWVSYISVNSDFQNQGLAKKLFNKCFEYAKQENLDILMSGYTMKGFLYIRHYIHKLSEKYGVKIKDNEGPTFYNWDTFEGFDENEYRKLFEKYHISSF